MKRTIGVILFSGMVLISCSTPETGQSYDADEAIAEIEAVTPQFDEYIATQDADALANLFTEDAIRMPPNETVLNGKAAIRAAFASSFQDASLVTSNRVTDVSLSGNTAVAIGTYRTQSDSIPDGVSGKWIAIFELQDDGGWKITKNMWNTDTPTPCDSLSNS